METFHLKVAVDLQQYLSLKKSLKKNRLSVKKTMRVRLVSLNTMRLNVTNVRMGKLINNKRAKTKHKPKMDFLKIKFYRKIQKIYSNNRENQIKRMALALRCQVVKKVKHRVVVKEKALGVEERGD